MYVIEGTVRYASLFMRVLRKTMVDLHLSNNDQTIDLSLFLENLRENIEALSVIRN